MNLSITPELSIELDEIDITTMRSQGKGGQNVNKTESAVHLRFDIQASSLPDEIKQRLLAQRDQRISGQGQIVIKAQQFRSQDRNRAAALQRLSEMIALAAQAPRLRKATRPSASARRQRTDDKVHLGRIKSLRRRSHEE